VKGAVRGFVEGLGEKSSLRGVKAGITQKALEVERGKKEKQIKGKSRRPGRKIPEKGRRQKKNGDMRHERRTEKRGGWGFCTLGWGDSGQTGSSQDGEQERKPRPYVESRRKGGGGTEKQI